jgi:glycosyltransferase involved in cell wall biosynthesis
MNPFRILHIGSGNLYGGIERALVAMAKYRSSCHALDQHFALCFPGRLERELAATGVPVFRLGEVRISRLWTVLKARRRLRQLLNQNTYHAVICHAAWPMAVFGATVPPESRLVYWLHDVPAGKHWLERWARRIRPWVVVCNGNFTAEHLHYLYPDSPKVIVRYPVDLRPASIDARRRIRESLGTPSECVVIIQVSRMEPWKGQALHIKALAKLKSIPDWQCWIIGGAQRREEATYLARLKSAAEISGVSDRVRFLGQRADVEELLAAADIFCQPNEGPEPFGIVFIEALAAGLPVVATAMGGASEIVNSDCGILTPRSDADALAGALEQLIQNPALRRKLGAAGPARARHLCAPEDRVLELYRTLCATKGTESSPLQPGIGLVSPGSP